MRRHQVAALLLVTSVPCLVHAQVEPGDTGTSAAPIPPWERRSAPRLAIGGGGLYQSGRAAENAGAGFDVFGSIGVSALALGAGYQRSSHRVPGADGGSTYQGLFVEPRVALGAFRSFTPYVAGRVGFLTHEVSARTIAGAAPAPRSSDRVTTLGAGLGTLASIAPGVQLDLGAMYTDVRGASDVAPSAIDPVRRAALLRVGVTVGLDRWGR